MRAKHRTVPEMSFVQSSPIALLNRSSFNRVLQSSEVSTTVLLSHVLACLRLSSICRFGIRQLAWGAASSGFIHPKPMSGDGWTRTAGACVLDPAYFLYPAACSPPPRLHWSNTLPRQRRVIDGHDDISRTHHSCGAPVSCS